MTQRVHWHTAQARPSGAGRLDAGFGKAGLAQVYFPGSTSSLATGVAVCPDGKLLVAAKVGTYQGYRFGLARLKADGSADLGFGEQGAVIGQFEGCGDAMAAGVVLLADGRILIHGLQDISAQHSLPALAMFDVLGHLDRRFGDGGKRVVHLPGQLSVSTRDHWVPMGTPGTEVSGACVQEDGAILLLANHHYALANHVGVLIRVGADGELDKAFNGRGFVIVRRALANTWLGGVHLQADGRVLVAGASDLPPQGLLARYNPDGSPDVQFGDGGMAIFHLASQSNRFRQVLALADGRLRSVGHTNDPLLAMARGVQGDGGPDLGFNDGQASLIAIGHQGCQWTAATLQGEQLIAVGSTQGGFEADIIVARWAPGGTLDPGFGQGRGWVRTRLGPGLDTATAVALQEDGRIVVAGHSLQGNFRAVVVRYMG